MGNAIRFAYDDTFQPVNHDAVVFYEGLSVFSRMAELVNEAEQGAQLARDLGNCRAILMRNHGVTTVAGAVEEALVLVLNLERHCRLNRAR